MRVFLLFALLGYAIHGNAQPLDAIEALFQWIRDLGGEIHAEVKINSNGVRGLFATTTIAPDEYIASIPGAAVMNVGSLNESFAVPTLSVLRELKNPQSRFKPYINTWPKPDEIVNSCIMDMKYAKMLKSSYWEKNMEDWGHHLTSLLEGQLDAALEYTIKEMVGNAEVTLDDLKYACAISSTRYVTTAQRRRLLMVPIFDLANHDRSCSNALTDYTNGDFIYFVAGKEYKAGDEICYSYGDLRDDYAVIHYGFLPELEDPPRLSLVDHREHLTEKTYSHDAPASDQFEGTHDEMRAELARLKAAYQELKSTPDALTPQPKGVDYVYDMLKGLEQRRLNAMAYEIRRLSGLLNVKSEL